MNGAATQSELDSTRCPLCGGRNDCQLCAVSAYKGQCWCAQVEIPDALLAEVPAEWRNKACICRACVIEFARKQRRVETQKIAAGDFYFDSGGLMVFTAAYHLRRGYCCDNGCRHCPYTETKPAAAETAAAPDCRTVEMSRIEST